MTVRQHLEHGVRTDQLLEVLERELGAVRSPPRSVRRVYLDTFDWLIYRADAILVAEDSPDAPRSAVLRWIDRSSGTLRAASRRPLPRRTSVFASQLTPSTLRTRIESTVGIRALLPRLTCTATEHELVVRNADDKTVLRVVIEDERSARRSNHPSLPLPGTGSPAKETKLPAAVRIEAIRGYDSVASAAHHALRAANLLAATPESLPLDEGLTALDQAAGADPAKPQIQLKKKQATLAAAQTIGAELSAILRLLEPGTRDATDIEFLHDYRVTVRRTRSAIGLLRQALPPAFVTKFAAEFKWLGTETTPARDLDVYLEQLPRYEQLLGDVDLTPLRTLLTQRRERAYKRIRTMLATKRYQRLLDDFDRRLASATPDAETGVAAQSVGDFARKRLARLHQRVMTKGRAITDASPAESLHDLRKDCKKLRYGLEFFRTLFPSESIQRFVRALKKLQDNLGAHQDYEVQADFLREVGPETAATAGTPDAAAATLLAMGALIDRLEQKQQAARSEFAERFAGFDTKANRMLAASMFRGRSKS